MSAPKPSLETLRSESLREILAHRGLCLTLRIPGYKPGAQSKHTPVVLNTYIQEAARQLEEIKVPPPVASDLLEPLRELAKDSELLGGSHRGRIIFRAQGLFRHFYLAESGGAGLTIAGSFDVRPILNQFQMPAEFYLLKLSKERVELARCADHHLESVDLPKGTPSTLEEMLALDKPDHDLENRSSAGKSVGAMRGVRFGTGSGRETQHAHLTDFYKAVDRGVRELLKAGTAPLALVGVEEHAALYHSISSYRNLLTRSIHGSPDSFLQDGDLVSQGHVVIRVAAVERTVKDLSDARERFAPARFSTDLNAILRAEGNGRIDRLYIEENARREGAFNGRKQEVHQTLGCEDLLNLAAVETILQGGQVYTVPDGAIPEGGVAAVYRF